MHIPNFVVSGPKFTRLYQPPNVGGTAVDQLVFLFWISPSLPEIFSLKLSKIARNFACFWATNFVWEGPHKFWDLDYKTLPTSDHMAKIQGDQPWELVDLTSKDKN